MKKHFASMIVILLFMFMSPATIHAAIATPSHFSPWVDTASHSSFSSAHSAAASTGKGIIVSTSLTISTGTTITVPVQIVKGGMLTTTATVTISGSFDAGRYRVFTTSGAGVFVFTAGSALALYHEWWGDSSGDSGAVGWYGVQGRATSSISSAPSYTGQNAAVSGRAYIATGSTGTSDWKSSAGSWVDSSEDPSFSGVVSKAVSAGSGIIVSTNITISTATTITVPMTAVKGGSFTKSGAGTLAINGPFEAGLYQVFSGFTSGLTFGNGSVDTVRPEWLGGVLTDAVTAASVSDKSLTISTNTAITSSTTVSVPTFIVKGALLSTSPGATFTFSGAFNASRHKIFASTTTGVSFTKGSITEVYPEWWGARAGAGSATDYAANTAAIVAAFQLGQKVKFGNGYYYHTGIALIPSAATTEFLMEGIGNKKTILYQISGTGHNVSAISSASYLVSMLEIRDLGIISLSTNSCGIYAENITNWKIENNYITDNGSHGIKITGGGSRPGSFVGSIRHNRIYSNNGDGVYQVATSSGNQQNASYIENNTITANANGVTVWGVGIHIANNVIEGSGSGKAIRVQNLLTGPPIYNAQNISITKNYMEGYAGGLIYTKTSGTTSGYLSNYAIRDNYGYYSAGTATYVPVQFYAGARNEVRRLDYRGNNFNAGIDVNVVANFADALAGDCTISPSFALSGTIAEVSTVTSKYIGLGNAHLEGIKSLTLYGYWDAKGGSGITYSGMLKSDNTTTSGSNTYFPVRIPIGSAIYMATVPVETDSTNYAVTLAYGRRSYSSTSAYTSISGLVSGNTGTKIIEMYPITYTTANRIGITTLDQMLELKVTFTTPGTYFYFGNPTIYYH